MKNNNNKKFSIKSFIYFFFCILFEAQKCNNKEANNTRIHKKSKIFLGFFRKLD